MVATEQTIKQVNNCVSFILWTLFGGLLGAIMLMLIYFKI